MSFVKMVWHGECDESDRCPLCGLQPLVTKEVGDLQTRLDAAEKALAAKQQQIDVMKQEIYQKEKELETISVFQAQVGFLCVFSI